MKRVANIINIIILVVLAGLGVAMIVVGAGSYPLTDSENALVWIAIIFQLIMVLVMAITGILFPAKDTYLNEKQSIGAMIVLALNVLVNKTIVNTAQIDVATGERPLRRGWEPVVGLVWMFFQAILSCFTIVLTAGSAMAAMHIATLGLIMLFIMVSFIWRIEDNKERYGKPMVKSALIPSLIALLIFAIGIVGGVIKTKLDTKDDFNLAQIKANIEEAKEQAAKASDNVVINEEDYLTAEEMITLIRNSMDTDEDIYYKIQSSSDNSGTITFIVWTESGNDVCWFKFTSHDKGYVYDSSMKSDALTKKDVEGKEDGIL